MDLYEYQKEAYKFAQYNSPNYSYFGLVEEMGELFTYLSKVARGDYDQFTHSEHRAIEEKMKKEMGDILWMIAAIATDRDWNLSWIAQSNISKLKDRAARNKIKGEGDDR